MQIIQLGTTCEPVGGNAPGFGAAWIGLQPDDNSSIVQGGFIHIYQVTTQISQYCRFWAHGTGVVHLYGCDNQTPSSYVYFKIVKYWDSVQHVYRYDIQDCGSANPTYTGCTSKDATQAAWNSEWGTATGETNYGGSACTIKVMGSPGNQLNIGTPTHNMELMNDYSGSWTTVAWNVPLNNGCSHYKRSGSSDDVLTWDDRN